MVSGGWDLAVKLWDIRQQEAALTFDGPYICGDSIDMHSDYLVTGSYRDKK